MVWQQIRIVLLAGALAAVAAHPALAADSDNNNDDQRNVAENRQQCLQPGAPPGLFTVRRT